MFCLFYGDQSIYRFTPKVRQCLLIVQWPWRSLVKSCVHCSHNVIVLIYGQGCSWSQTTSMTVRSPVSPVCWNIKCKTILHIGKTIHKMYLNIKTIFFFDLWATVVTVTYAYQYIFCIDTHSQHVCIPKICVDVISAWLAAITSAQLVLQLQTSKIKHASNCSCKLIPRQMQIRWGRDSPPWVDANERKSTLML